VLASQIDWITLDKPLFAMHSADVGIGQSLAAGIRTQAVESFLHSVDVKGGLMFAPVPKIVTNMNVRVNEFIYAFHRARSLQHDTVNLQSYCDSIWRELRHQKEHFPHNAPELLMQFANANRITFSKQQSRPILAKAKELARSKIAWLGPLSFRSFGKPFANLPAATGMAFEKAIGFAITQCFVPNQICYFDNEWS
jgi:hypothetical protein